MAQGELVHIPAGNATLGIPDLSQSHDQLRQRYLPAFAIEKYEVSNRQYRLCLEASACTPLNNSEGARQLANPGMDNHPVMGVDGIQAARYCNWLGRRLPTTDEWERAARGPEGRAWPWGDEKPSQERVNMLLVETDTLRVVYTPTGTLPVASNQNGMTTEGVFNMVGNVAEWTSSIYPAEFVGNEVRAATWDGKVESINVSGSQLRLFVRGGAWSEYAVQRITEVASNEIDVSAIYQGIRCAANVSGP
jgi:formylglycine-generating enzyme required for sulfatase activity